MDETAVQLESEPPATATSDWKKSEAASERVKVSVAVSPLLRDETSDVTAIVGLMASTVRMMELLKSKPSRLVLPAESENLELATEITPLLVLSSVGVNVAEKVVPEPEKLDKVPPVTKISASVKSVDTSESVKLRIAVSPAFREVTSELTAMVGLTVSMERVSELLASDPSRLLLPAASENLELATEITPSVVLLSVGVKVAV